MNLYMLSRCASIPCLSIEEQLTRCKVNIMNVRKNLYIIIKYVSQYYNQKLTLIIKEIIDLSP